MQISYYATHFRFKLEWNIILGDVYVVLHCHFEQVYLCALLMDVSEIS